LLGKDARRPRSSSTSPPRAEEYLHSEVAVIDSNIEKFKNHTLGMSGAEWLRKQKARLN